ncbi:MAG: tRNA pseudouridine(38-40) synthase TruA [Myxococcales bacterium]|nr:tRNA pseudouridine(38-40) synthase TruA [Polyangiaceae bacterium]MDW8250460.1 tRNA pseudouridine(38-40) synthase TruA [Myxococcales bacterium]
MTAAGVLLTVAYDGGAYAGWAPQKHAVTVAGTLLEAIRRMAPAVDEVRGVSRTDAGVHARGQRVAFDAPENIPLRGWVLGLTRNLPPDISVRAAARVETGFDPRFHSIGKRYIYTVLCDPLRDPFLEGYAWRLPEPLDLEPMRRAAATLLGTHDFRAFRAAADERTDTTRTLRRVEVLRDSADPRLLRVIVEGDRFLYHMVRILAGTLVDIGAGRREPEVCAGALASGERALLGQTAPARGLLLDEVFLDREGTERWPP